MRTALEEHGVPLPAGDELVDLSRQFNEWLEFLRYADLSDTRGKAASTSWYNLFLQADLDDSGFITFDELREVVRKKIKKRGRRPSPMRR